MNINRVDIMKIVFDIGGSILCPNSVPDVKLLKKISDLMINLYEKGHRMIIVTGGGKFTKNYIKAARNFTKDESFLDVIGIQGTRMNALLMIVALGDHAYKKVVKNIDDLQHGISTGKIVVMGGTVPGQTTDAVSVAAAEYFGADMIIIATDVDGVYERDPKKYKKAKLIKHMKPEEIYGIVRKKKYEAGSLTILDPVAAKLLVKNRIKTIILNGRKIDNMKNAIEGKKFKGTVIGD